MREMSTLEKTCTYSSATQVIRKGEITLMDKVGGQSPMGLNKGDTGLTKKGSSRVFRTTGGISLNSTAMYICMIRTLKIIITRILIKNRCLLIRF